MSAQYIIERLEDGGATVSEVVPQQIAIFTSELHAEAFVAMLSDAEKRYAKRMEGEAQTPFAEVPVATKPIEEKPAAEPMPAQQHWQDALDRIARGEGVKDVAEATGLPFTSLRAKWANRVHQENKEARTKPAPSPSAPFAPTKLPAKVSDAIAIIRSARDVEAQGDRRHPATVKLDWSEADDVAIATADECDLPKLAEQLGRATHDVARRRAMIEAQIAKEMSDV